MTIYKPKNGADKKLGKKVDKPPVVVINDDTAVPLTQSEFVKADEGRNIHSMRIFQNQTRKYEHSFMKVCTVAAILSVFIFAACLGYFVHKKLISHKPLIQTIHVQFHEYRRHSNQNDGIEHRIDGGFYEQVEMDLKTEVYEKLTIPPFVDVKSAIAIHDFNRSLSAIVDRDMSRCFVLPLNRTVVNPPRLFMEYIEKTRAGFGLPNAKVERQVHRVVTPPVDSVMSFGDVISSDCKYYDTYLLVKANAPVGDNAVSKRFSGDSLACRFSGDKYSLGETGYPLMILIILEDCP